MKIAPYSDLDMRPTGITGSSNDEWQLIRLKVT
jgi:hypothetical protein